MASSGPDAHGPIQHGPRTPQLAPAPPLPNTAATHQAAHSGQFDLADEHLSDIKHLAATICHTDPSNVTIMAFTGQPSAFPLMSQTTQPRTGSFFAHTLLANDLLIIPDTQADPRYATNPAVRADPPVASFIGVPLLSPQGQRYGVLSVVDRVPRHISAEQKHALTALGRQLTHALEASQTAAMLRKREEQQTAVSQLGVTALSGLPLQILLDQACKLVFEVLDVDYCGVLETQPSSGSSLLAAGEGWKPGLVGIATLSGSDAYSTAVIVGEQPVVVHDFATQKQFAMPSLLREHCVISSAGVSIPGQHGPWGALFAATGTKREFTYDDVVFLQLVANTLSSAVMRNDSEAQVRHQALHDTLTGLPNRALLLDRLQQHFARSTRTGVDVAALFIDLDDFKPVNDTLGHEAGDELLIAFSQRLRTLIRPTDTISRLAGDEFVVIVEEPEGHAVSKAIAERISDGLTEPFRLRNGMVTVSASIGIALASTAGNPETLLRNADAAMYQAKRSGNGKCAIFDETLHTLHLQHLQLKQALRGALERDELRVLYQPIVGVNDRSIGDVEALLRWEHPELGLLAPKDFVGLAEDSGLIIPIGRWVIEQACQAASDWYHQHHRRLTVHINLSGRQLSDPGLVEHTRQALQRYEIPGQHIGFEITESTLCTDIDNAIATLNQLKKLGVHLAIDDFGTGYSSLSYLKHIPMDVVKIDQSFIEKLGTDQHDRAIVTAVVRMTEALGLHVTAEGVENHLQLRQLQQIGCEAAQGFLFSQPCSAEQITTLLHQSTQPLPPGRVRLPPTLSASPQWDTHSA